jgi:hypothetical protein
MVNPASAPDETCTLSNPIDLEEDLDSRRRCAIALETAAELLINVLHWESGHYINLPLDDI